MRFALKTLSLISILLTAVPALADDRLKAVIADDARPEAEAARDMFRHPYETLTFFGIQPEMTVVELAPSGGWYTEILGPYLAEDGLLIGAHVDIESENTPEFYQDIYAGYLDRISDTDRFGAIEVIAFEPPRLTSLGDPGSADMVLTFRSTHGWQRREVFGDVLEAAREVLKPGGVLGVVQHRLPEGGDDSEYSGYVKQSWVVAMAESHGFRLVEASDINANPDDSADHPEGVWSLPPSLRDSSGAERERFEAIGESDRMTLKFVKR